MTAATEKPSEHLSSRRPQLAILCNPNAGKGLGAQAGKEAARYFENRSYKVRFLESQGPGNLSVLAKAALRDGSDLFVTVGGDGSLHEVVHGLLSAEPKSPPKLGLIPVGTGNDYAKVFGLHKLSVKAAAARIHESQGRLVHSIAYRDGAGSWQYAINNIGLGFLADAVVATEAAHQRRGQRGGGRLRYVLGGLQAIRGHQAKKLRVRFDDEHREGEFSLIHIGLGRYCGGGVDLVPESKVDGSDLSVCLVDGRGRVGLTWIWLRLERGGCGPNQGVWRHQARELDISGDPFQIHADGELQSIQSGQLTVRLCPKSLMIRA